MKKIIEKLKLPMLVIMSLVLLSGCGNQTKKQIGTGMENLNQGNYDAAQRDFKGVLKADPKNEEAKKLDEIITGYTNAMKEYGNKNYEKAKETIDGIPKEYEKYKIKEDINKLGLNIESKLDEMKKNDKSLEDIGNYMKNDKLDDAKKEIDKISSDNLTKEQLKRFEDIKNEFKIKGEKKE